MKSAIGVVLICVTALASVALASSVSWGYRNGTDILIYKENVIRFPLKNDYQSASVYFPESGHFNARTIAVVYIYDRFTNSSGAQPSLWAGGPGYRFASINLKSLYNKGINSTVEIYGKK
ncbi:uncharacterized protein [Eurosta solidaginis]|uniref:uncharacterized protein n=1 Tax=Eurosta solidaginis TaxID=178769 RepID=UPI003530E335